MSQNKRNPSFAGQFLKKYQQEHYLTQEQLAEILHMEPRTLRAYENGERQLNNVKELTRIADILGVELEALGVTKPKNTPNTVEEIDTIVKQAWSLMDEPRIREAHSVIEKLVQDTSPLIGTQKPELLQIVAEVYHAAGYIVGMGTGIQEIARPIYYYQQLETIARTLHDDTWLNIALTYQGDLLRRSGNVREAIVYLEEARDGAPLADTAAKGNALQLLGRTYLLSKDKAAFERSMAQAEEFAYALQEAPTDIRSLYQYNVAAVYEEYGKSYGILGKPQKALDYLVLAEKERPKNTFWETLLMIARAEVLIYNDEISSGLPIVLKAAQYSQKQGHRRRLERIYGMKRYLSKKALTYGKAEAQLSECLDGPVVQWERIE